MASVYTIGYAAFNIDDFIDVLKNHKISHLIDVRSNPVSEYFQDYNLYLFFLIHTYQFGKINIILNL